MKVLVETVGKAEVFRAEIYNHGTSAKVEWEVVYERADGKKWTVKFCKTRKEALIWAKIYCN